VIAEKPCDQHVQFELKCKACWTKTQAAHAQAVSEHQERERRSSLYYDFHERFVYDQYCSHEGCEWEGNVIHALTESIDSTDPRLQFGVKRRTVYLCCHHFKMVTGDMKACEYAPQT
jgi:hypothetical protein